MRILIIGSTGQVGHELLACAPNFPALAVTGMARPQLDVTDTRSVTAAFEAVQPQMVINASAWTAVDRAESEREAAFSVNRDGVALLADACAQRDIPLLHISTDYVFDGHGDRAWTPADTPAPLGAYGASKLAGELAAQHCPQHLVLRTSWVFGAHGNNFVRTMVRLARERAHLRVVADQVGGPTWAGDIAEVLLMLASRHAGGEPLPWGTWHYAAQPWVSWHQLAVETIARAYELGLIARLPVIEPITTADYPLPAPRPLNSRLDMQDTLRALKLAPPDWRAGLAKVLADWQRAGIFH